LKRGLVNLRDNRDNKFIEWFEMKIYGELIPRDETIEIREELNMTR
tara:strand:- start:155 stop:292 length:138 start_codon:yes stop_codon:yes gene_type:complete